ncbi:MAG: hypothetical protein ACQKBY_04520 [Verrucomicrobiales bacterium]
MKALLSPLATILTALFLVSCGEKHKVEGFEQALVDGEKLIEAVRQKDGHFLHAQLDADWAAESSPESLSEHLANLYRLHGEPAEAPFVDVKQLAEEDLPAEAPEVPPGENLIEVYAPLLTRGAENGETIALDVRLHLLKSPDGFRLHNWSFEPLTAADSQP